MIIAYGYSIGDWLAGLAGRLAAGCWLMPQSGNRLHGQGASGQHYVVGRCRPDSVILSDYSSGLSDGWPTKLNLAYICRLAKIGVVDHGWRTGYRLPSDTWRSNVQGGVLTVGTSVGSSVRSCAYVGG